MTLRARKIAVIGAGIGGLAVARALAMRDAEVSVLEQAEVISEVGAGLQISPNGFAVLNALGLGSRLRETAMQGRAVCLHDYRRGEVLRLDLTLLGNDNYYFAHRADLIDLLAEGARAAGAKIRLLQKVSRVVPEDKPIVEMANGATLEFDLVVGADGLHSRAREALNGVVAPFFTRQVAWRTIVANSDRRGPEVQVHMGPRRHVVSYPLRGGEMLNIVAVQEQADWTAESWSQKDDPATVQAVFRDFGPDVRDMLARIETVHLWGLFRHPVARNWQEGRTVLIGDAAHPTLPFLAQGASMALEDGWVLADTLSQTEDLDLGLKNYQSIREGRVRRVIAASSGNARKYHLSFPPLRWAAHLAIRVGGAVAPGKMMRQYEWLYNHDVTNRSK